MPIVKYNGEYTIEECACGCGCWYVVNSDGESEGSYDSREEALLSIAEDEESNENIRQK
jgi:hypothetical protein